MTGTEILLLIIALFAIAAVAWLVWDRYRSHRLKEKFGPEYDRTVTHEKSARRAEAILGEREKRIAAFHIRPLSRLEADRFTAEWKLIQERFVDEPNLAVAAADKLITEAMHVQGYPVSDFEQNAADLSVEHPRVVSSYRIAHDIAAREEGATTENLRVAMLHYRTLFEEIADVKTAKHEEVHHGR